MHPIFAPVAQTVEHLTFNQGVRSSSLRRSTNKKPSALRRGLFVAPAVWRKLRERAARSELEVAKRSSYIPQGCERACAGARLEACACYTTLGASPPCDDFVTFRIACTFLLSCVRVIDIFLGMWYHFLVYKNPTQRSLL